jgi:hypothetical protein
MVPIGDSYLRNIRDGFPGGVSSACGDGENRFPVNLLFGIAFPLSRRGDGA